MLNHSLTEWKHPNYHVCLFANFLFCVQRDVVSINNLMSDLHEKWRRPEDPRLGRTHKNPCRIILLDMGFNEKALRPIKFVLVAILKEEDHTHKQHLPSSRGKLYIQPPCRIITACSNQVVLPCLIFTT